jgi:hypothetical protein
VGKVVFLTIHAVEEDQLGSVVLISIIALVRQLLVPRGWLLLTKRKGQQPWRWDNRQVDKVTEKQNLFILAVSSYIVGSIMM